MYTIDAEFGTMPVPSAVIDILDNLHKERVASEILLRVEQGRQLEEALKQWQDDEQRKRQAAESGAESSEPDSPSQ